MAFRWHAVVQFNNEMISLYFIVNNNSMLINSLCMWIEFICSSWYDVQSSFHLITFIKNLSYLNAYRSLKIEIDYSVNCSLSPTDYELWPNIRTILLIIKPLADCISDTISLRTLVWLRCFYGKLRNYFKMCGNATFWLIYVIDKTFTEVDTTRVFDLWKNYSLLLSFCSLSYSWWSTMGIASCEKNGN